MSGWGKANGVKDESIVFASDDGTAFSKEHAWVEGERTNRYGMIIDHGKVIYSEVEPHLQVSNSSNPLLPHLPGCCAETAFYEIPSCLKSSLDFQEHNN